MRKLFSLFAALTLSVGLWATPASVPTVTDLTGAGYDLTGRVICLYFDEQVCNDIVWAGSYNGGSTTPVDMMPFEPLEGFDGWYVIELWDDSDPCQGKPVQLKKDGSFSWDFQSGDAEAWINMAQPGTKTATIDAGLPGEANCTWPTTGAYIYEVEYFKNHNTPCGEDKPKHDYTITAYLPQFCDAIAAYADSVRVMGGFDNWSNGVYMQKIVDEDFNDCWVAEIKNVEEGTEFKLRFGTDAEWKVQVRYNGENMDSETFGTTTSIVLHYDGEGYDFAACAAAAPEVGDQFVDATYGLKFEVTAVGDANTVKVIKNNYTATSYIIPDTVKYNNVDFAVTEIGTRAFDNCESLQSITIPDGVITIGTYAFEGCSALQSITIPAGVTEIQTGAFAASGLQTITIPAGVTEIQTGAFYECTGLTSVTFLGNACQDAIGGHAFDGVGDPDPALLTLPNSWTGSKPDEDGNWYGGKFELSEDPSALPTLPYEGKVGKGSFKFFHNGRLIIEAKGKRYNAVGF